MPVLITGIFTKFPHWKQTAMCSCSVPQGSVLGPALFICYISDMWNSVSCFIYMYVDDTEVSKVVGSIQGHTSLQTDLNEIHTWSDTWQLKFNSTKCKVMHMGYANKWAKYSMKGHGTEVMSPHLRRKIWASRYMINWSLQVMLDMITHTHTHTTVLLLCWNLSGTTRVSRYQKG